MATITRLIKLPMAVRGMTVTDPDGNYNVYINKNMAYEVQRLTYYHEAEHIMNDDLYMDEPVYLLENRANYKVKGGEQRKWQASKNAVKTHGG